MNRPDITTSPVMKPPFDDLPRVDFSNGFDPSLLKQGWGIGGYNVKRRNMYVAPQYENKRNIHMGVDIWAPEKTPVYSPRDGVVAYGTNHDQEGNYGATLVLKHVVVENNIFALYGHLSLPSLEYSAPGRQVSAGDLVGWLGKPAENGNWHPHLHYQLCRKDPGEADMPGVVSEQEREQSLHLYPDPVNVMGSLV